MIIDKFVQQPREIRAKRIDYSLFFSDGDSLNAVEPIVTEVALICGDADDALTPFEITQPEVVDANTLSYYAGGGASGNMYKATFLVTTTNLQVLEHEIIFTIKEI